MQLAAARRPDTQARRSSTPPPGPAPRGAPAPFCAPRSSNGSRQQSSSRWSWRTAGHVRHVAIMRAILGDIAGGGTHPRRDRPGPLAARAGLPPPRRQAHRSDPDGRCALPGRRVRPARRHSAGRRGRRTWPHGVRHLGRRHRPAERGRHRWPAGAALPVARPPAESGEGGAASCIGCDWRTPQPDRSCPRYPGLSADWRGQVPGCKKLSALPRRICRGSADNFREEVVRTSGSRRSRTRPAEPPGRARRCRTRSSRSRRSRPSRTPRRGPLRSG